MYIDLRKFCQGLLGVIMLGILLAFVTYSHLLVDLFDPSARVSFEQYGQQCCIDATSGYYDSRGKFVQHGTTRRYFTNGELFREERYAHGVLHGLSFYRYRNGEVAYYVYYDEGLPVRSKRVVEDLHVEYCSWVDRTRNGPWRLEDVQGNLIGEAFIVDGFPDGVMTRYDPPGVLYAETFWKDGEMTGKRLHQPERPNVWAYAYDHFPD